MDLGYCFVSGTSLLSSLNLYFLRSIIIETLTILERFKISETYLKWIKESDKKTRVPITNLCGLLFSLLLLIIKRVFYDFLAFESDVY